MEGMNSIYVESCSSLLKVVGGTVVASTSRLSCPTCFFGLRGVLHANTNKKSRAEG